jgi:hypothetical protein
LFLAAALPAQALLADLAGATATLASRPPDGDLPTVEVVCDRAVRASLVRLGEDRLLVPALGGYLLMEPSPSARVEAAQKRLETLGYDPGAADGVFGDKTAAAIAAYQKAASLPVTGALSDDLIEQLQGPAP